MTMRFDGRGAMQEAVSAKTARHGGLIRRIASRIGLLQMDTAAQMRGEPEDEAPVRSKEDFSQILMDQISQNDPVDFVTLMRGKKTGIASRVSHHGL